MTTIIFQKPSLPLLKGENTFIDLHVHSRYSQDSFLSIPELLKTAKDLQIGLAICDHNEIRGVMEASQQKEIVIIPSIEVCCQSGTHFIFYFKTPSELEAFFKEIIKPHVGHSPFVIDLLPFALLEKARRFECLISLPHPFLLLQGGIQRSIKGGFIQEKELLPKIDLIEAMNGLAQGEQNIQAISWAKKVQKPIIGGSDSHLACQIGTVLTKVSGKTREEVYKNLKAAQEIIGQEMTGWKKWKIKIKMELKLILRKGGLEILKSQIQKNIK